MHRPANAAGRRESALVGCVVQRRAPCASRFRRGTLAAAPVATAGSAASPAHHRARECAGIRVGRLTALLLLPDNPPAAERVRTGGSGAVRAPSGAEERGPRALPIRSIAMGS